MYQTDIFRSGVLWVEDLKQELIRIVKKIKNKIKNSIINFLEKSVPVLPPTEQKFVELFWKKQTVQYKFNLKEMQDAQRNVHFLSQSKTDLERIISTALK